MAIFETNYTPTTSVGTIASICFNAGSVSTNTGNQPVTVINTGSNTVYVSGGSLATTSQTGIPLLSGMQLVVTGGTAITLWAQTGVVGQTSTTIAGLGTLVSVV